MKMVETAKLIKNWGIVNMKPRSMNLQISNRKYAKLKKNIFGFPMKSCIFLISDEIQCFFWFPGEIPELIFGFKSLSEKFSVF